MIVESGPGVPGAGGFQIEPAAPADAEAIAQVHARAWRETYAGLVPDELADRTAESRLPFRRRILEEGETVCLKLTAGGRVVGFADAGPYRDTIQAGHGEVYAIYLLDETKRRGRGTILFSRAAEALAARGLTELSIWVLEQNAAARAFYERYGGRTAAVKDEPRGSVTLREVRYHWPSLGDLRARLTAARQST